MDVTITTAITIAPVIAEPPQSAAEAAARAAGWIRAGDGRGVIYHPRDFDSWKEAASWGNEDGWGPTYDDWATCCEDEGIPYEDA